RDRLQENVPAREERAHQRGAQRLLADDPLVEDLADALEQVARAVEVLRGDAAVPCGHRTSLVSWVRSLRGRGRTERRGPPANPAQYASGCPAGRGAIHRSGWGEVPTRRPPCTPGAALGGLREGRRAASGAGPEGLATSIPWTGDHHCPAPRAVGLPTREPVVAGPRRAARRRRRDRR